VENPGGGADGWGEWHDVVMGGGLALALVATPQVRGSGVAARSDVEEVRVVARADIEEVGGGGRVWWWEAVWRCGTAVWAVDRRWAGMEGTGRQARRGQRPRKQRRMRWCEDEEAHMVGGGWGHAVPLPCNQSCVT
jgi:poly(3-hydroxybutyrate) depolymerase